MDGGLPSGGQGQDVGQRELRLGGQVHPGLPVDATPGDAAGHQPSDPRHPDRGLRRAKVSPEAEIKSESVPIAQAQYPSWFMSSNDQALWLRV